ncbi:MAG: lytic transglycosylase domain-containing protein [Acidimicrobiia bacterium]
MTPHRARARRFGPLVVAVGLATAALATSLAGAQVPPSSAPAGVPAPPRSLPSPELPGLPDISRPLTRVPVVGAAIRPALVDYDEALDAQRAASEARIALDRESTAARAAQRAARAERAATAARSAAAGARRAEIDAALGELAVALYVRGAGLGAIDAALVDPEPAVSDEAVRQVLAVASTETLFAERAAAAQAEAEAEARRAELDALLAQAGAGGAVRDQAVAAEVGAAERLTGARAAYEQARVLAPVSGVDFPLVALDAYWRGAEEVGRSQPTCGLRWWGLAGISRVEGRHGTYGGSSLDGRGETTVPIIGIPLDGTSGTRLIADSDGGSLDGDPVYDRAVGPMQFIPTTWARWAADGNGDGTASPHNLYDAALAAARYLCAGRAGLDGDDGLREGYFSYNRSEAYVETVLGHARQYEAALAL